MVISELTLTLLRLGFLALLWIFVLVVLVALRRDLRAPREATNAPGATTDRPASAPKPKRSRKAPRTLVVTEGSLVGTTIPLGNAPITLGRSPDNTIEIDDDYASGHHAKLVPAADGNWVIEDLGSTNGTWLDRSRITSPTVLPPGVPLRVGRTTLELRA